MVVPEPQIVSNLFLRGKATYAKTNELLGVMRSVPDPALCPP